MIFDELKPGMIVWSIRRHKIGNTSLSTVSIYQIEIISVDPVSKSVTARCYGNGEFTCYKQMWSKWKKSKPVTIKTALGQHRLATRAELDALKEK